MRMYVHYAAHQTRSRCARQATCCPRPPLPGTSVAPAQSKACSGCHFPLRSHAEVFSPIPRGVTTLVRKVIVSIGPLPGPPWAGFHFQFSCSFCSMPHQPCRRTRAANLISIIVCSWATAQGMGQTVSAADFLRDVQPILAEHCAAVPRRGCEASARAACGSISATRRSRGANRARRPSCPGKPDRASSSAASRRPTPTR